MIDVLQTIYNHEHRYEQPDYAVAEDAAVIVTWRCTRQPHSTVTDNSRDETYIIDEGPPCEATERIRFDLTDFLYDGIQYGADWPTWPDHVWDAFGAIDGAVEIDDPVENASNHDNVTVFDVARVPDGYHDKIVLEAMDDKRRYMAAGYEITDTDHEH